MPLFFYASNSRCSTSDEWVENHPPSWLLLKTSARTMFNGLIVGCLHIVLSSMFVFCTQNFLLLAYVPYTFAPLPRRKMIYSVSLKYLFPHIGVGSGLCHAKISKLRLCEMPKFRYCGTWSLLQNRYMLGILSTRHIC